jgi:phosphate transport system protein
MPRSEYQRALEDLQSDVVTMGEVALIQVESALELLQTPDPAKAESVIDGDQTVNEWYLDIEADCIELFALQQPVATDLRVITSSYKITTDLERIGDLATNLAGYAVDADRSMGPEIDLYGIGSESYGLVEDAIAAYEAGDTAACRELSERDDRIDTLCHRASQQIVRDLIEREADRGDPWEAERLMDDVSSLLLSIRDLERIADHGVNIAARTLYLVEGETELIY